MQKHHGHDKHGNGNKHHNHGDHKHHHGLGGLISGAVKGTAHVVEDVAKGTVKASVFLANEAAKHAERERERERERFFLEEFGNMSSPVAPFAPNPHVRSGMETVLNAEQRQRYIKEADRYMQGSLFEPPNYNAALLKYKLALRCHQPRFDVLVEFLEVNSLQYRPDDAAIGSQIAYCYQKLRQYDNELQCLKKLQGTFVPGIGDRIAACMERLATLKPSYPSYQTPTTAAAPAPVIIVDRTDSQMQSKLAALELERSLPAFKTAAATSEQLIIAHLTEAKDCLQQGKLNRALTALTNAKSISFNEPHKEYFQDANYSQQKFFESSIEKLQELINNYRNDQKTKPYKHAKYILHLAIEKAAKQTLKEEAQTLLHDHHHRIIRAMTSAIFVNWNKFHNKTLYELDNELFDAMAKLLAEDFQPMDWYKAVGRKSWANWCLQHSKAMHIVLESMIDHYQPHILPNFSLPIFGDEKFCFSVQSMPPNTIAGIDWQITIPCLQATLARWDEWLLSNNNSEAFANELINRDKAQVFAWRHMQASAPPSNSASIVAPPDIVDALLVEEYEGDDNLAKGFYPT